MPLIITKDPLKSFLENINENKNVLFTGSRRFYTDVDDFKHSDFDYVMTKEDWLAIDKNLGRIYVDSDEKYKDFTFASYHLKYKGDDFNIIVVNTKEEFRSWEYATNVFIKIIEETRSRIMYTDKGRRVALFEILKACYMNYRNTDYIIKYEEKS
jgi:hypothetical protein